MELFDLGVYHGHGEGDNGACSGNITELQLVSKITDLVVKGLRKQNLKVDTNNGRNIYNNVHTKNISFKHKFTMELHMNSGGGKGSEILVPLNESYLSLEENIMKGFSNLGLQSRGLKSRNYDTDLFEHRLNGVKSKGKDWYKTIRESWGKGVSHSIIEIGFIDNEQDRNYVKNNMDRIANIIVNEILNYLDINSSVVTLPHDFDSVTYLKNNLDVLKACNDNSSFNAEYHYLTYGHKEPNRNGTWRK